LDENGSSSDVNTVRHWGKGAIDFRTIFLDGSAEQGEYDADFKARTHFSKDRTSGKATVDALTNFLNRHYCRFDEEIDLVYRSTGDNPALMLAVTKKGDRREVRRYVPLKSLARGFHHLLELYFPLRECVEKVLAMAKPSGSTGVILLEEPETHLHPRLQKLVPVIIHELLEEFGRENLQFFIATHSPFIISEGIRKPDQRAYLLSEGSVVDFAGTKILESPGYGGERCLGVVADLLGAGLSDIQPRPKTFTDMRVVYCEGSAKDVTDAELYSIIFTGKKFTFVSCGGAQETIGAYYAARAALPFVFGEGAEASVMIDRSCSIPNAIAFGPGEFLEPTDDDKPMFTDTERKKWLTSGEGNYRMLLRREIENYLFDPAAVDLLEEGEKKQIEMAPSIDYQTGNVKDGIIGANADMKKRLAHLIYLHKDKETKTIYDQLLKGLQGEE
jgi:hypothetical protein